MSTLEVNTITPQSGTTLTLGGSGDTVSVASGASLSGFGSNKYPFKANLSASQGGIDHDSFTKVNLNTATFDPDSKFDTSNYRYVPAETGYYYLTGSVAVEKVTPNFRRVGVAIYKNGSELAFNWIRLTGSSDIIEEQYISVSILEYSTSTSDYYELYVYQNNASGLNSGTVAAGLSRTYFTGFKLV